MFFSQENQCTPVHAPHIRYQIHTYSHAFFFTCLFFQIEDTLALLSYSVQTRKMVKGKWCAVLPFWKQLTESDKDLLVCKIHWFIDDTGKTVKLYVNKLVDISFLGLFSAVKMPGKLDIDQSSQWQLQWPLLHMIVSKLWAQRADFAFVVKSISVSENNKNMFLWLTTTKNPLLNHLLWLWSGQTWLL